MSHSSAHHWSHSHSHAYPPPSVSVDQSASFSSSTFPAEDQPSQTEGGYSDAEELLDQDVDDNDVVDESIDDQESEDGSDEALSDTGFEDKMESQLGLWKPTEQEFKATKDLLVSWDWETQTVKEPDQGQVGTEQELVAVAHKAMRRALYSLDRDQWRYDSWPADEQTFAPPFPHRSQRGHNQSQTQGQSQGISVGRL
ncbi:hypothetical protein [Phaffia rhodozyma]|uniref:Uncharacterized protein n=1 Tax=Phaffia rhodozyma TaxID=264483 RepID=A0A0F7SLU3_PHARH|nr:hypothetical protein [Phaffia rhodozyma]